MAEENEKFENGCTLTTHNLYKRYKKRTVVHDVSFQVKSGEVVGLLGPNGAGKTTCFYMVVGLVACDGGEVYIDDTRITHLPIHRRAHLGVSYLPQEASVFRKLTVMENIQTGLEKSGGNRVPDELFELFPVLFEMRHRKGGNLSGGQQQQLAIARALATDPAVLLLDEPTEGIQPSIIKEIAHALNEIRKLRRITLIVSEQVLSFALAVADRILVLERGRIIHEDRREDADVAKITGYLSV